MAMGQRIKNRREWLGISQTTLAEKVKISKQTLYKYETNIVANIPYNKIEEIAKILGVSPVYLMGWENYYSDEATELAHEMPKDKLLMDLYFYCQQLSDTGKKKLIDTASDLAKIYQKENSDTN